MLLDSKQVHHFSDIGYQHGPFYNCPANAAGGQLPESGLLGEVSPTENNPEAEAGIGCRCRCDRRPHGPQNFSGYCGRRLKHPNTRDRGWLAHALLDRSMRPARIIAFGALVGCAVIATRFWWYKWSRRIAMGLAATVGLAFILHGIH